MWRERRTVYRNGYIQFANLTYLGKHLAAYAGESVIIRYNPYDTTTIYIYQLQNSQEVFLIRAHAQGWETEILSYKEAQALAQRRRQAGLALDNRSMLAKVRARDEIIKQLQRQKQKKPNANAIPSSTDLNTVIAKQAADSSQLVIPPVLSIESVATAEIETTKPKKPVPYVRLHDYEQLKREAGFL